MSSFILDWPLILGSLKHDLHTNVLTKSRRPYSDGYQFLNQSLWDTVELTFKSSQLFWCPVQINLVHEDVMRNLSTLPLEFITSYMTTSVVLYPHLYHVGIELIQLYYFTVTHLHLFCTTVTEISILLMSSFIQPTHI